MEYYSLLHSTSTLLIAMWKLPKDAFMNGGWAHCNPGWLRSRIWEATWDNRDFNGRKFLHTLRMFLAARPCHTVNGF